MRQTASTLQYVRDILIFLLLPIFYASTNVTETLTGPNDDKILPA